MEPTNFPVQKLTVDRLGDSLRICLKSELTDNLLGQLSTQLEIHLETYVWVRLDRLMFTLKRRLDAHLYDSLNEILSNPPRTSV